VLEKTISQVDPKVIAKTQHTLYIHTRCHARAMPRAYDMFVCYYGFVEKIKIYIKKNLLQSIMFSKKNYKAKFLID